MLFLVFMTSISGRLSSIYSASYVASQALSQPENLVSGDTTVGIQSSFTISFQLFLLCLKATPFCCVPSIPATS